MNLKAVLVALILSASVAQAEEQAVIDKCEMVADLAESAMKTRQRGVKISDAYKSVEAFKGNLWMAMARLQIEEAYEVNLKLTEWMRETAINQFRDKWFRECLDSNEE